jgi:nitronate monooxygenase
MKTTVIDLVRNYEWPGNEFEARALRTPFVTTWHGREAELRKPATNAGENKRFWDAFYGGDAERTGVMISEAVGLIRDVRPAGDIIRDMVAEAGRLIADGRDYLVG